MEIVFMALCFIMPLWLSAQRDKFEFLVSVESKDFMMGAKANELAKTDSFYEEFANKDYRGNMNITIIKTTKGRTIMFQHDATSPSPETYIHGIYIKKIHKIFNGGFTNEKTKSSTFYSE